MSTWTITLGEEISKQRKAQKLSQAALAGRLGISRITLSKIENGHQAPNLETLASIALELGGKGFEVHGILVGVAGAGSPQVVPAPVTQLGLPFDLEHRFDAAVVIVRKNGTDALDFAFSLSERNVA